MAEPQDLTIEILKQIRDELVTTRTDLGGRIDELRTEVTGRIDQTNARIDHLEVRVDSRLTVVESTLLEVAEQQRFMVRHLSALTSRDRAIEGDVDQLKARVDAIEKHLGTR